MYKVICPECKKRWEVEAEPSLSNRMGAFCQFCDQCCDGIYRRLFRWHTWEQEERRRLSDLKRGRKHRATSSWTGSVEGR